MQDRHLFIHRARLDDAALIAEFGASAFEATFGAQNRPQDMLQYIAENFSPGQIKHELDDRKSIFLLAYEDEQLIGYAKLHNGKKPDFITSSNPIELARIYVKSNLIGAGYGSALMRACLETAFDSGYSYIWLDVWEKNTHAIRFYEKWGFVKLGMQVFHLGDDVQDDFIMGRPLSNL